MSLSGLLGETYCTLAQQRSPDTRTGYLALTPLMLSLLVGDSPHTWAWWCVYSASTWKEEGCHKCEAS